MSVLLTWLWQGIVVAAAAAVLLKCAPRASADTRHAAYWVALAAVLCIPIALLAIGSAPSDPSPAPVPDGDADPGALLLPGAPPWVGVACAIAWVLASAAGVVRLAGRWRAAHDLARRSSPFDARRQARLPLWLRARTTARRQAELRASDDLGGACALGFRRPMILIGRRLSAALDDEALDLIVLHEQAHLARRDDVLQAVQACVLAVAGWHPAVWWLSRRIDLEREAACDDYVLAESASARRYAAALLHAAAEHQRGAPAVALPAATQASALRVRVQRLFDQARRRGRPTPLAAFMLALPMAVVTGAPPCASFVVFAARAESHVTLPLPSGSDGGTQVVAGPTHGSESMPPGQQRTERMESPSAAEPDASARQAIAARPRVPGAVGLHSAPSQLPLTQPRAHVENVLPTARRESAVLGLSARAPDPRPSRLMDALAPVAAPRGPWASIAESSAGAASGTATAVADGAKKGGLSVGRAFTRAGRAVASSF